MATDTRTQYVAERLRTTFEPPPGLFGKLQAVSHKNVGKRYMIVAFFFFLIGGVEALLLRAQLAAPNNDVLGPELYNELFTLHGSTMMYLFVIPFLEGMANYFLPLMLGTRDLPFPRLNAFNFWSYLFGGTLVYASFLFAMAPKGGWYAYPPLTLSEYLPGAGMDFWLIGISLAEISAIGAAIELIVVAVKQRAPGMSLNRLPLFVWAIVVAAVMIVFAFTVLLVGSIMLQFDRKFGTQFFDPAGGGDPVLWQHLFWVFGHPEVYIMFLPAAGIVSQVVQTFSRRAIVGYTLVAVSVVATGFLSFGLWVHHMFTVGIPLISLGIFAAASYMITFPSGIQVFAWIVTLWRGIVQMRTPLWFVIGFVITFVAGGISGVMVATVPFDWQVHDSYFLIAHFHYVLFGGVVFPIFAGLYYWLPKLTGRLLSERLGQASFWLIFIGFNVTFFPMHISGLLGMPRRVYTYPAGLGWEGYNLASTIGAYLLAVGIAVSLINFIVSRRRGAPAGNNPYGGDSLEWATSSPPAPENFRFLPVVFSRTPLWDSEARRVDERAADVVEALAHGPVTWRATLGTTPNDARPSEVVYIAGPTALPLVAGIGLLLIGIGSLASSWPVVIAGSLIGLVGGFGWLWRGERERWRDTDGFSVVGLPVDALGARATGWWGLVLLFAVLASVVGSLVFSYFFLGLKAQQWPPSTATPLALLGGLVIAATLAFAAFVTTVAARRAERRGALRNLLIIAALLAGAAVVALHLVEYARQPVALDVNAYGSLVFVFQIAGATFAVIGVGMTALALAVSLRMGASRRLRLLVANAALYWWFTLAAWLALFASLYISPLLL